jgi:drug/metabolite transporter (DMT)-like permease
VHASSPISVTFWTMTAAALFWAPLSGWWRIDGGDLAAHVSLSGNLAGVEAPLWALVAWNVVCGTFLPFLLSFLALGRLRATAAGIVASSEVLFAFVVAWLWLGETLGPVQLVGGSLVLAGIVLAQTSRITETGLAQPVDATMPPPIDPGLIGTAPIDVVTGAIDVIRVDEQTPAGRDVGGRP